MKGIKKQSFGDTPPVHVIGHDAPLGKRWKRQDVKCPSLKVSGEEGRGIQPALLIPLPSGGLTFPGFSFHMPCASPWWLLGSSPIPTVKNSLQMAGYSSERLHVESVLPAGLG